MQFGNPCDSILQSRFGAIRRFEPKMVRSSTSLRLLSNTKAEVNEIPVLPISRRGRLVSLQFFWKASELGWHFPLFHHVEGRRSTPVSPWSFHGFSLPTGQWPSHRRIPFSVCSRQALR